MIFDEQISRKPNNYPWTEDAKKAMHDGFWTDKVFTFTSDVHDFKTVLSDKEREIVVRTLSAIGQIEVAVKTFWSKLGENFPQPCFSDLGFVMANVEVIHNDAYERLLSVLGLEEVFEQNLKLEWIQGRVKYLKKYTHRFYKDSKKQYLYALILFTLFVENVSLFSQFYVINWFARFKNVLAETDTQVKYTRNEETVHAMVGMKLINTIREEYPDLFEKELEEKIIEEANQAFIAESKIIDWMVNGIQEENLSAEILKEFIKERLNDSLAEIGFEKPFSVDDAILSKTFWFKEELYANTLTDFFKKRPTEYSKNAQSFNEEDLF